MTAETRELPAEGSPAGSPDGRDLPAGEVTFLFSDIEASTRAWERHPTAMPAALARHQQLVRGAVCGRGGAVVKDTGDGLFAVFGTARAGVLAAVEAQRGLRAAAWGETGPLRARMGLHTAEAEPEHGDYHGVPVNRCARLMGVAHGGQVLVSDATYRRLALDAPPDVSFLDLGRHRLRDLSVAVQVLQVLHPDLPAQFPPLRSLDAVPNNLPAVPSSLVGRREALAELADALDRTRLLTLTGAGGIGKTRLALQLAADRAEAFTDGVWVVDLAGLSEPELVAPAVASALRIAEQPGRSWVDSLLWFLRDRHALLVLDNCEHLLDTVASLTRLLLESCSGVKVLATTREALNTPGEVAWVVPPLPVSDGVEVSDAERLFVDRAREFDVRYRPGRADRDAVAQICRRLDGLPLAIELAAARTRVLAAGEIAERLDDRFRLLTGGARTALPRQRTLEAAVAWSYDMLDEPERRLFDRLSVFAGGFTLPAAEDVCSGDPIAPEDVLDLLSRLTDRSLVVREQAGPPSRYRLLETMRSYGRDRLLQAGETQAVRDAHLAWAARFVRAVAPQLEGADQRRWLDVVDAELDNIRAALGWSLSGHDVVAGLDCASSLYRYWYVRAVREGRLWLDRLLDAAGDASPRVLAKALYADGSLTGYAGDCDTARARHERALGIYRQLGHRRGEAWALHGLGVAEWGHCDPATVRARFTEAKQIFRDLSDPVGLAFTLQFLGLWEIAYGDSARAIDCIEESEPLVHLTGMPLLLAHHAEDRAWAVLHAGHDPAVGRDQLCTALDLYSGIGSTYCVFHALESVAFAMVKAGRPDVAARLLGAVDALRAESGTPVPAYEHILYDEAGASARAALGTDTYGAALAGGAALSLDQALDEARAALGCRSGTQDRGATGADRP